MPPAMVVERAAKAGLDVLALTDHDSAAGWAEATDAARRVGLGFVPGIELSSIHEHRGVHVLAYLVDPTYPPLAAEMRKILAGRDGRLDAMVAALATAGIVVTAEEVRRQAGKNQIIGRPHVADALVARGIVRDRSEAFERLLNPGRSGFVVRYAPATRDLIRLVTSAGGAAVVAHPWGRGSRHVLDAETLADFARVGLVGIEVDHEDHSELDRSVLRAIAADLGLIVTGSSDFHGAGKVGHDLGCNVTPPYQFEALVASAAANAAASGRPVPPLLAPAGLSEATG
jgi:predicted metal-dependent phosphoesterase TrpH